jgi:SAM-dependent methyltransferase
MEASWQIHGPPWAWRLITHRGVEFMGPYGAEHFERLFADVELSLGARVLDIGCGTGALLAWLAEHHTIAGVGIDLHPPPNRQIPGVRLIQGCVTPDRHADWGSYDLTCMLGAGLSLEDVAPWTRPGGLVLYGGGYWRQRSKLEPLAGPDAKRAKGALVSFGAKLGLELVSSITTGPSEIDAYDAAWLANGERYAAEHASEPEMDEFLDWIRTVHRYDQEAGKRDTLEFLLLLFRREEIGRAAAVRGTVARSARNVWRWL